ncbi:cytoskeleton-associated protein 2-like isoform X2 [Spea bombifrons]|uniref:cytoskeleton-associated protein 2-like isoform X2 n=1 Tax=Spea bombifrons TaxID=233779 RepID=UPI00234A9423|nr:cytoskeleton-associated protein 2-like isoform X2 [Spea bombifrons]
MVASTSRNPSRDFSLKKKASWHNEISKSLHPVTSKLESHPVHRAESTKTCTASMQNRAAGKTIHVNSARTTSLHAKVSHSIQTAAASCPVTKTCSHLHKPVGRPQNSSALTKPATIQHGTGNTAKTSLNNHTTRTINKQSAKEQVAKSSHGTVPPRLQNTTNLWHKQKADAVSSSMKTPSGKRTNSLHKASVMNAAGSSTSVHLSNMQGSDEMSNRYTTPKTAAEDRKRRLEEWLLTKGKTYKRPPMTMPPKKPDKSKTPGIQSSFLWAEIEEEEELLLLSQRINATLSECLELINKGAPSQDIHSALGKIPHAKKFAKFWVCKARLNEREGIFDVIDLYEQGVKSGAQPMNELRDAIFDIMKSTSKKSKVTFGPLPSKERVPVNEALEHSRCPISTSVKKRRDEGTPCGRLTTSEQGSAIKFQVSRVSSIKKETGCQEWKRLTPVRRSVRISEAMPRYPEVLKEHDTVVASLGELLDMADTDAVLYTRNEALPDEADEDLLDMINQDRSELKEEPV